MSAGYIYILRNKAFGANVVKIGMTSRTPDVRAREIYRGSTGVPQPFEVAVAFSVGDCVRAEKVVHAKLKVYRINMRREFFRLPMAVGANIVEKTCEKVNVDLGLESPTRLEFPVVACKVKSNKDLDSQEIPNVGIGPVELVDPRKIRRSAIKPGSLTVEQIDRAKILCDILAHIGLFKTDEFLNSLMRDYSPEDELRIWEHLALAYMTLQHADDASLEYRREAGFLLLQRTWFSTAEVIESTKLIHFSSKNAKRLLDAYTLRPKPLLGYRGLL